MNLSILALIYFQLLTLFFSAYSIESGSYSLQAHFPPTARCPDTLTISQVSDSSLPTSSLPSSAIIFNDTDICTGKPIQFKTINPPELLATIISKFIQGSVDGSLQCGDFNVVSGASLFFVKFAKRTSSKFLFDGSSPTNQSNPILPPQILLFFEPNIFYLISTNTCIWKRTGTVDGILTETTPSPEENEQDDEDEGSEGDPLQTSPEPNGPSCFPNTATVKLRGGSVIRMDALRMSDVVQTGRGHFALIFAWTHQQPSSLKIHTYTRLKTRLEKPLILTPSHYVYKDNGQTVPAGSIRQGDSLIAEDYSSLPVLAVDTIRFRGGLYNPHTTDGDIVVNGVLVSTYTSAIPPNTAHALLLPLRAAFKSFWATRSCVSSR